MLQGRGEGVQKRRRAGLVGAASCREQSIRLSHGLPRRRPGPRPGPAPWLERHGLPDPQPRHAALVLGRRRGGGGLCARQQLPRRRRSPDLPAGAARRDRGRARGRYAPSRAAALLLRRSGPSPPPDGRARSGLGAAPRRPAGLGPPALALDPRGQGLPARATDPGAQQGGDRSARGHRRPPRAAALPHRMAAHPRAAADALSRRVEPPPPPPRPAPVRGRTRRADPGLSDRLPHSPPRRLADRTDHPRPGGTERHHRIAARHGDPRARGGRSGLRYPGAVSPLAGRAAVSGPARSHPALARPHAARVGARPRPALLQLRGTGTFQAEVSARGLGADLRDHGPAADLPAHPLRDRRRLRRRVAGLLSGTRAAPRPGAGGAVGRGEGTKRKRPTPGPRDGAS
jgi:hypothetical protein